MLIGFTNHVKYIYIFLGKSIFIYYLLMQQGDEMKITKNNIKLAAIGLTTGIVNGLFGSGGGTIIVPALIFIIGLEEHKAHATAISIILPLTLVSTIIYFRRGILRLDIALPVILGGVIGGFVGAKILNRIPNNILRKIFGIFMIIAAIKLVMK
ncbi:sulfite exporter TauE/SafE family protein [Caldisalinibacter kiritimatiensis]|nr:sulfite exporter TauE/SafE family protein [Caldisalinibacter kiritimatiensis]